MICLSFLRVGAHALAKAPRRDPRPALERAREMSRVAVAEVIRDIDEPRIRAVEQSTGLLQAHPIAKPGKALTDFGKASLQRAHAQTQTISRVVDPQRTRPMPAQLTNKKLTQRRCGIGCRSCPGCGPAHSRYLRGSSHAVTLMIFPAV